MSWPIPLETLYISPYYLETLSVLASSFRDHKIFALLNLETPVVLAYSFRCTKIFALFI